MSRMLHPREGLGTRGVPLSTMQGCLAVLWGLTRVAKRRFKDVYQKAKAIIWS